MPHVLRDYLERSESLGNTPTILRKRGTMRARGLLARVCAKVSADDATTHMKKRHPSAGCHVCIHIHTHTHTLTCMYGCRISMSVCRHACLPTHMHMHMHMHPLT